MRTGVNGSSRESDGRGRERHIIRGEKTSSYGIPKVLWIATIALHGLVVARLFIPDAASSIIASSESDDGDTDYLAEECVCTQLWVCP